MIDIVEQTNCKVCGKPLEQKGGKGHRQRVFCSDRCKQADYRRTHHGVTSDVTIEDDRQALDQKNIAMYQEKLATCAARIEKLEHQVEVQRQRLSQSYQSTEAQNIKRIEQYAMDCSIAEGKAKERIAQLEQRIKELDLREPEILVLQRNRIQADQIAELERDLAAANDLIEQLLDKKQTNQPLKRSYQDRLTRLGEKLDWPALDIHITVKPGRKSWRVFMINESNDQLIRAIIAAERVEEKHG